MRPPFGLLSLYINKFIFISYFSVHYKARGCAGRVNDYQLGKEKRKAVFKFTFAIIRTGFFLYAAAIYHAEKKNLRSFKHCDCPLFFLKYSF